MEFYLVVQLAYEMVATMVAMLVALKDDKMVVERVY